MNSKDRAAKVAIKKGESLNSPTTSTNIVAAPVKAKSDQTAVAADQDKTLNAKDQELLAECETDIERNLQGTFVLGHRLEQIRDQELYRATHTTFANYCREKWDFSKTHANRLVQAYLCEKHLKSVKDVEVYVPTKESQARIICALKPEQQVEVASEVKAVVGDKQATAVDFEAAREKLFPTPKREAKAPMTDNDVAEDTKFGSKIVHIEFDTKLVSFSELNNLLKDVSYIVDNPGSKNKALKMINQVQQALDSWADWQAEQLKAQEVA